MASACGHRRPAGKIAEIGDLSRASAGETIDVSGLTILPGMIDTQVHFREPGPTHKEDLETGSRAAVLGGVTAVFEMPNTNPLTITPRRSPTKFARDQTGCIAISPFGSAARPTIPHIPELERLPGAAGIKVFMGSSTGSLLVEDDAGVAAILRQTRRRAAFHSEDEYRGSTRGKTCASKTILLRIRSGATRSWRCARPSGFFASRGKIARLIHVLHVSCGEEIDFIATHKDIASVEVTPHHLTLCADDYARLGTKLQMNPPVRDKRHRDRIWYALAQGIVDILGSDHAPHTLEEKAKPYPQSPSGMTGVQTLVPIMLDHVEEGRLSIVRFIDMTSAGPGAALWDRRQGAHCGWL